MEESLTGSREWNTAESARWWRELTSNSAGLPPRVLRLLEGIAAANVLSGAGFRRNAVPPLLYRYFTEMRACFVSWHTQLRPGEAAVLVVGRNRTGPKGSEISIDTPTLLGMIASTVGFDVTDQISLETWPLSGLHAANAVNAEDALVLRRSND
ncbi:MAG: hypothetical protein IPL43_11730 [Micropruina sp.]|nr:hypothetical protein [Micropruina sp.]